MAAPLYYQSWPKFVASLTAADSADYDGSGVNVVQIVAGPAAGSRDVFSVEFSPKADVTQGNLIRFFLFLSGGSKIHLLPDLILPRFKIDAKEGMSCWPWFPGTPLTLGVGDALKFSQEIADTIDGLAKCGDRQ